MFTLPSPFKTPKGEAEFMAAYEASLNLWPVRYEHLDVSGRYGRTHLLVAGPEGAPAIVLLHGDFFSSTMWAANIADLSRDYRVYAADLIGQPNKSVPNPDKALRTRGDAAAWISEILDALKLQRVTLVGMSYGGWYTLNYAICAPERLERIILLSPGGSFRNERFTFYLYALPPLIVPFLPAGVLFSRFTRSMIVEQNLADPVFLAIYERLSRQVYVGYKHFRVWKYWHSQNIAPHVFPDAELRSMHVPTLLLVGKQESLYDPVAAVQHAKKLIPDLESDFIPLANHAMTIEQHEIVNKRVLGFLQPASKRDAARLARRETPRWRLVYRKGFTRMGKARYARIHHLAVWSPLRFLTSVETPTSSAAMSTKEVSLVDTPCARVMAKPKGARHERQTGSVSSIQSITD